MTLHGVTQSALVFGVILSQAMTVLSTSTLSSTTLKNSSSIETQDYSLTLFSIAVKAASQSKNSAVNKALASIKLQVSLHLTRLTRLLSQYYPQSESYEKTRSSTLSFLLDAANAFLMCEDSYD